MKGNNQMNSADQRELKKHVGKEAVKHVKDGMVLGLGSGTTIKYMVDALSERIKNEGLDIIGVPTSNKTKRYAESLGITTKDVDKVDHIDLTIDGADQIDKNFQGIKGGGAAHLMEKIVAINSDRNMWIVDESKMVKKLNYPLPLEVIPYGSGQLYRRLNRMGLHPKFRQSGHGGKLTTDSGDYIIDLGLPEITTPVQLGEKLDSMTGIVEHGLFLNIVNTIIVEHDDGPETIEAR
ncbi:ribose-5-phosphate isomerase A [Fructilactobacillus fructivorans]|nr:ribose-5-phosphate isomerase A [Fructilactobacillus fructivorans]